MANVYDSVSIVGLRKSHFKQLESYLEARDREGWYYGNKEQFEKRHADLKSWVGSINESLLDSDTRIREK